MRLITISSLLIIVGLLSCQPQTKFEPVKWQTAEDPAFPPQSRKAMLNDLVANYKLTSMSQPRVVGLLGEPDYSSDSTLSYRVIEDYGSDIDPVYTKTLEISLNKDKTVKGVNVTEWKK